MTGLFLGPFVEIVAVAFDFKLADALNPVAAPFRVAKGVNNKVDATRFFNCGAVDLSCAIGTEGASLRVVNREYDIRYIAGYSVAGRIVFIGRHLPRFRRLMKTSDPFLLAHEDVEKALLDELLFAFGRPQDRGSRRVGAVKAADISWWAYQSFIKGMRNRSKKKSSSVFRLS